MWVWGGIVNKGRVVEGAGRNNGGIIGSFKREFDYSALRVNTKSQVLIRLKNWFIKDLFIH